MTFARKILNLIKEAPEPGTLPDKGHMPVPFSVGECHFNLTPDQRATAKYEDVDLHSLIATQRTVDAARVQELMSNPNAETGDPVIVRSENKLYIADGHHRLTRDFLKGVGRQSVKVVTEGVELVGKIDKTDIESAAENVHARWMENQKKKGHNSRKSPDGKEEYMVGYDELSEPAKKLDRDAVHAVLDALKEAKQERYYVHSYLRMINPRAGVYADYYRVMDRQGKDKKSSIMASFGSGQYGNEQATRYADQLNAADKKKKPLKEKFEEGDDPEAYYGKEKKQSHKYECSECGKEISRIQAEIDPERLCPKCLKWKRSRNLKEDGMAVGNGGVAGIGVNQQGQPSDDKFAQAPVRKKLVPEDDKFAGADVFKVNMDKVMSSRYGPKNRYHRYAKYIGNDEDAEDIRAHARSNRNDVVLQDKNTGVMQYLRKRKK